MSIFFDLPPELMTALATVLGFAFLGDLSTDQQNALGNFLMLAAQIMITNASQAQQLQNQSTARQTEALEARLARLEALLEGRKEA